MRALLLLATLSLFPSPAHAGVDFKCDSVNYEDQVGGWIRFGYAGRNGSVQMEFWNAFPPHSLVDANLDNGTLLKNGGTRFVSEPDHHDNTVAIVDAPTGYLNSDKFLAKTMLQSKTAETGKQRTVKYELNCVRH